MISNADSMDIGAFMAARIEKLAKGDLINPPCDRCRRLKFDCTKHLTACTACTKKHAKCSWKEVKEDEGISPYIGQPTNDDGNSYSNHAGLQGSIDPGLTGAMERNGVGDRRAGIEGPSGR